MRTRLASLALLLAPMVAGATGVRDTTACLDTLHASDSVAGVVTISVRPQNPKTKLPADFEGLFAEEIRSRLKLPRSLPLSVMIGWNQCVPSGGCAGGTLIVGSVAYATVHPTGGLSRIAVIDLSRTPDLSDSVRTVLERIGQEKMSPPFFDRKDSIPVRVSIDVHGGSDTVPPYRRLFRINLPHYNLPFTGAESPKDAKAPKYPSIAETRGVGDIVAVTFTVLADGTVPPQSVDVHAGRYAQFIRSVFETLATARYLPASVGGCPVASRVSQSFAFQVPRRSR